MLLGAIRKLYVQGCVDQPFCQKDARQGSLYVVARWPICYAKYKAKPDQTGYMDKKQPSGETKHNIRVGEDRPL